MKTVRYDWMEDEFSFPQVIGDNFNVVLSESCSNMALILR